MFVSGKVGSRLWVVMVLGGIAIMTRYPIVGMISTIGGLILALIRLALLIKESPGGTSGHPTVLKFVDSLAGFGTGLVLLGPMFFVLQFEDLRSCLWVSAVGGV